MKRILSFHIVSQIGYMLMGLGLFSVAGVAGAVFFLVHQIPVKTMLFLAGGLIEIDRGTSSLDRISGLIARRPVVALLFAIPALSLAGIPPFSGFVAKLSLVDAGIDQSAIVIVVVALAVSILTLLSMLKIWTGVFWGPDQDDGGGGHDAARHGDDGSDNEVVPSRSWSTMVAATGVGVSITIGIAVMAGPLFSMSERAAAELLDNRQYVAEVLAP